MKRCGIILLLVMVITIFTGCGESKNARNEEDKLNIVSTIFVPYDFARQIGGDNVELTMLLKPGTESHSYEPTPRDIIKIQNCDLFIYVGGESDKWIEDMLTDIGKEETKVLTLMECVDLYLEEDLPGLSQNHNHHGHHEHDENCHHEEYDDHVWTSPVNGIKIVKEMTRLMGEADKPNKEIYETNAKELIQELEDLHKEFLQVVSNANRETVVFGDRFPLRYFVEEYDLDYYAAFPGCSADTEPNAATIAFLIDKIKEEKIPVVFYIELSNQQMARALCEATNAKRMCFYTCHNVTKEQFENGATYVELMKKNVVSLKEALN